MTKEVRKKQYKWALESLVFAFLFVIEIAAWIILEIN
jgi:hypothetical protein